MESRGSRIRPQTRLRVLAHTGKTVQGTEKLGGLLARYRVAIEPPLPLGGAEVEKEFLRPHLFDPFGGNRKRERLSQRSNRRDDRAAMTIAAK